MTKEERKMNKGKWFDKFQKDTIVMIAIEQLVKAKAKFNPRIRETAGLKTLEESMKEHGPLAFMPIPIGYDGSLGDGHRRITVALKLYLAGDTRFAELPAYIVSNQTGVALFCNMNRTQRKLSAKEQMHAVDQGLPINAIPDVKVKNQILFLQANELFNAAVEANIAPGVVGSGEEVFRKLKSVLEPPEIKGITPARIVRWMIGKRGVQQAARNWVISGERGHCNKVVHAVRKGKALRQPQWELHYPEDK